MRETELYPPVKAFLEDQGYAVKGEIGAADVVALRDDEPPVIVELKTGFSLTLIHQGIDRQAVTPHVYLAVPDAGTRRGHAALRANLKLVRRLGLGLLTVRLASGAVTVHCDPGPFRPRLAAKPRAALLREFAARRGDPAQGGATRDGLMTAYRQDAQAIAAHLAEHGACRGRDVRDATGVARATAILHANHYGWFEKVSVGIYALSGAAPAAAAGMVAAADTGRRPGMVAGKAPLADTRTGAAAAGPGGGTGAASDAASDAETAPETAPDAAPDTAAGA